MPIEIVFLIAGVLPGRLLRRKHGVLRAVGFLTVLTIHLLLFLLGASMGANAFLFAQLAVLGGQAVTLGIFCALGSAVVLYFFRNFFKGEGAAFVGKETMPVPPPARLSGSGAAQLGKALRGSGLILACFGAGLFLGRLGLLPLWLSGQSAALWILRLMMFFVGMGMGFDLKAFGVARDLGPKVLLLPLLVGLGTAAGALCAALLLPGMSAGDALCAGSGFGYYSLSSVLLTQLGDAGLGSVGLLCNITRELFSLICAPLLVRFFGHLAPLGAAGATSMDTCLPVIVRFCGERNGILAVFSGLMLTLAVPFVVPLVYNLTR